MRPSSGGQGDEPRIERGSRRFPVARLAGRCGPHNDPWSGTPSIRSAQAWPGESPERGWVVHGSAAALSSASVWTRLAVVDPALPVAPTERVWAATRPRGSERGTWEARSGSPAFLLVRPRHPSCRPRSERGPRADHLAPTDVPVVRCWRRAAKRRVCRKSPTSSRPSASGSLGEAVARLQDPRHAARSIGSPGRRGAVTPGETREADAL
jgi:hypothetical protein